MHYTVHENRGLTNSCTTATNSRHLYVPWLTGLTATVYVHPTKERYILLQSATVNVDSVRER